MYSVSLGALGGAVLRSALSRTKPVLPTLSLFAPAAKLSNNGFVNPFHVLRGQFPRPPATLAGAQAIPPATAVHRESTENGRPADPKRLSHFVRRVPVLNAGDSAPTQLGQRLVRQGFCVLLHAEIDSTTSILCPYYFGKISIHAPGRGASSSSSSPTSVFPT